MSIDRGMDKEDIVFVGTHTHTHTHTHVLCLVTQSCPTLCKSTDHSPPGCSVMEFSRQEYYSGLPCPAPGDLPDPGIKPASLKSLGSLPLAPPGKPCAITVGPPLKKKKLH